MSNQDMKHTPGPRCDADHATGLCSAHQPTREGALAGAKRLNEQLKINDRNQEHSFKSLPQPVQHCLECGLTREEHGKQASQDELRELTRSIMQSGYYHYRSDEFEAQLKMCIEAINAHTQKAVTEALRGWLHEYQGQPREMQRMMKRALGEPDAQ